MPIPIGKSQGLNILTIQPTQGKQIALRSSSVLSQPPAAVPKVLGSDIIKIASPSPFLNPDLESVISSLGFTSLRPEILGAFEFLPLLDESVLKSLDSTTAEKSVGTTASAELVDLHMQLKQLRYSEVLEFLEKDLGIGAVPFGIGKILSDENDDQNLLEDFSTKMSDAKKIVDTLTTIYNAIFPVLEAMQIKTNNYMGSNTSAAINTGGTFAKVGVYSPASIVGKSSSISLSQQTSIATGLNSPYDSPPPTTVSGRIKAVINNKIYNEDWIQSAVIGNLGLKEYFNQYLGTETTVWSNSPGITILSQLMTDVAMRIFYPIDNYKFLSTSYPNGKIQGVADTKAVSAVRDNLLPLSRLGGGTGGNTNWYPDYDREGLGVSFSKEDFSSMWDYFLDSSKSSKRLGKGCYMAMSDLLVRASIKSGKLQDYVDGSLPISIEGSSLIEKILGTDATFDSKNIADISSTISSHTGLGSILPSNDDSQTGGKVGSFEYSSTGLPSGQYTLASGKSYFIDNLFTDDMGEVKSRLSAFSENLDTVQNRLVNILEITKGFQTPVSGGGYSFVDLILKYCTEGLRNDTEYMKVDSSSGERQWCFHSIGMMSLADKDIAYLLFKYIVSLSEVERSTKTESSWDTFFEDLVKAIAVKIIEKYPGFRGAIEANDYDEADGIG